MAAHSRGEHVHLVAYIVSLSSSSSTLFLISQPPIHRPAYVVTGSRVRLVTVPAGEPRPISPITPVRNNRPQQRPRAYIIDIMAVILAPANGNHGGAQHRRKTEECAGEIPSCVDCMFFLFAGVTTTASSCSNSSPTSSFPFLIAIPPHDKQPHLAREEQGQVPQPGKAKTRVAAGKTPPAVVQDVGARLGAYVDADEGVCGRPRRGLAAGDEVRARATDCVFDNVGEEGCEDERDDEAEQGDVVFVRRGAGDEVEEGCGEEGQEACVKDVPDCFFFKKKRGKEES